MIRRLVVEPSDDDEDFPEQDWETEGSGIGGAGKFIHRPWVCLGSMKAGTGASLKLKNQVLSLVDSLERMRVINSEQKEKIIHDYIGQQ